MIQNKRDLFDYLEADRIALGRTTEKPKLKDIIWKYEIALHKVEYYTNVKNIFMGVANKYYKIKLFILGIICNYSISINCIDKGLSLAHVGTIV